MFKIISIVADQSVIKTLLTWMINFLSGSWTTIPKKIKLNETFLLISNKIR